jgi:leader peptidase (prepilin peptidase)/N-methyltransferase
VLSNLSSGEGGDLELSDPRVPFALAIVASIGACVGSFINVVAYRLPRACMSIVKPRSRCPRCSTAIAWYDNLPVLSWILLRGRCRHCKASISFRYPAVEILVAAAFAAVAWNVLPLEALRRPAQHPLLWLDWTVRSLITAALFALALIDFDYRILPDAITKPGIAIGPVLAFLAPAVQPMPVIDGWSLFGSQPLGELLSPRWIALVHGVLGAAAGWIALWGLGAAGSWAFRKPAMGFGDVKMFAAMGAVLGFWCFVALLVAVFSGAIFGILIKLAGKGRYIPFGPFLAIGMWVVMLWGAPVLSWYLRLFR